MWNWAILVKSYNNFLQSETYLFRPFSATRFWCCASSYLNIHSFISDSLFHSMKLSKHLSLCTHHFLGILLCYACQLVTAMHYSLIAVFLRNVASKLHCEEVCKFPISDCKLKTGLTWSNVNIWTASTQRRKNLPPTNSRHVKIFLSVQQ